MILEFQKKLSANHAKHQNKPTKKSPLCTGSIVTMFASQLDQGGKIERVKCPSAHCRMRKFD